MPTFEGEEGQHPAFEGEQDQHPVEGGEGVQHSAFEGGEGRDPAVEGEEGQQQQPADQGLRPQPAAALDEDGHADQESGKRFKSFPWLLFFFLCISNILLLHILPKIFSGVRMRRWSMSLLIIGFVLIFDS